MGCYNSAIIDAPVEKVWNTIKDFHNLDWGKGVVETTEPKGSKKGNEVGASRVLNGVFHETLTELNPGRWQFKYSIDDGPGPLAKSAVQNYVGEVQLFPVTDSGKTFLLWTSSFESKDEKAVVDFCNPIYQGLLKAAQANIR